VCDNYALCGGCATQYSRTLLAVAELICPAPGGLFAPTLFRSARLLEHRVAGLLNPSRCTMTRWKTWKIAAVAAVFAVAGLALSPLAAAPAADNASGYDLTHNVPFQLGAADFRDGDSITIDEVIGTADTMAPGNLYRIKGSYKLKSEKSAMLAAYVTDDG